MKKMSLMVLVGALVMSSSAIAWNCSETRTIEKQVDIGALDSIRVQAGAGTLSIVGAEGPGQAGKIGIVAKLCASDEDTLADMGIKTDIKDGVATVDTDIPKKWIGNDSATIDLSLTVPSNAKLDVKDSSGDLEISGVAELQLLDSSGGIELNDIVGNVDLTDSSGSIRMRQIGSARVTDSSGGIDARNISRDFTVIVDSSGDIEVRGVGGDVQVKVDSSGSIDVEDVMGSFTVDEDGSGGISYDNVKGDVNIPQRKQ